MRPPAVSLLFLFEIIVQFVQVLLSTFVGEFMKEFNSEFIYVRQLGFFKWNVLGQNNFFFILSFTSFNLLLNLSTFLLNNLFCMIILVSEFSN